MNTKTLFRARAKWSVSLVLAALFSGTALAVPVLPEETPPAIQFDTPLNAEWSPTTSVEQGFAPSSGVANSVSKAAVMEPGTLALLGLGLVVLGLGSSLRSWRDNARSDNSENNAENQ